MRPDWAPPEVDIESPSVARIYDYNLGGSHNFAADRAAAEQLNRIMPGLPSAQRANRSYLRRAVRFMARQGIRQFLDLGSGIPTVGNVHEVARRDAAGCRVVYVDIDPIAAAHGKAILADDPGLAFVTGDLRDHRRILADQDVRRVLDFSRPLGVLLLGALHFVSDADGPESIIAAYRDASAPGSYLAISHGTEEGNRSEETDAARQVSSSGQPGVTMRDRGRVTELFAGYRLVEPGIVFTPEWRPETDQDELLDRPARSRGLSGVGVKEG